MVMLVINRGKTYQVYYRKEPTFWLDKGLKESDIETKFAYVKDVTARKLDDVFTLMQGEIWSPNGEARELIRSKGLVHTSMSVGDVIRTPQGKYWQVDGIGFKPVRKG